jgi:hypothetical protein
VRWYISLLAVIAVVLGGLVAVPVRPAEASGNGLSLLPDLGLPDQFGFAVADVDQVRGKLAAATGTQFTPVRSSTATVVFPEAGQVKSIRLEQTRSVRGGPFVELIEASPAIGPLAPDELYGTFYMSYSVKNIWVSSIKPLLAGLKLVAFKGDDFAFFRAKGGVLVRLIDEDLVPEGGVNQPQAPIDLGAPPAVAIAGCDQAGLRDQLGAAFGVAWRDPFPITLPYEFAADPGNTHLHDSTLFISQPGPPFLALEANLHAPPEYHCTPTETPVHLDFLVEDVDASGAQASAAGFPWIARVPGLTSFHGGDGVYFEIAHVSFLEAVLG